MQNTMGSTGTVPDPTSLESAAIPSTPLAGLPQHFEALRYLDGSDPTLPGEGIYAAAIQDATAVWEVYCEDARKTPDPGEYWIPEVLRSEYRLRRMGRMRKTAWFLDLLLKPVSWMLPCPMPFQRRLLKRGLYHAFQDTAKFALMRDMGQAFDSNATSAFAEIRKHMPRALAEAQFGRRRDRAADVRRAFSTYEEFTKYVPRWFPSASPLGYAMTQPEALRWVYDQVVEVIGAVPKQLLSNGVFGKICRSLFGVIAFKTTHLPKDLPQARLNQEILESMQAGIHFGITYIFDDLMDLDEYPREEKKRFYKAVVDLLQGGTVDYTPQEPMSRLVLKSLQSFRTMFGDRQVRPIYNAYLALALAQIQDGKRSFDGVHSEKEVFAALMVKSAYTRIVPALLGRLPITRNFLAHSYMTSLHHQMLDDLKDLKDDLESNTFTPYTYYVRSKGVNPDFRHPLATYLRAICMIVNKLGGHPEVRRLWASRLILALRVFEFKGGKGALRKFLAEHPIGDHEIQALLLRVAEVSEVVLDAESLLASLASTTSMHVRGMEATPIMTH